MIRSFLSDESGATAIEYALIISLISIAIIVTLINVGTNLSTVFTQIASVLDQANTKR
jgi:pilus assembly protein Flp/PilA